MITGLIIAGILGLLEPTLGMAALIVTGLFMISTLAGVSGLIGLGILAAIGASL